MSTKGKRPLLSAHEKVEAIRRVHDGESKASVARDIGVPESTLRGWCKNEDKILFLSRQSTPETSEGEPDMKKTKYDYPTPATVVAVTSGTLQPTSLGLNYSVTTTTPENLSTLNTDTVNKLTAAYDPKYNLLTTAAKPNPTIPEKREVSKRTLTERQRTRAELERLSVELGLNRPELGLLNVAGKQDQGINMSMLATSPLTSLNHMSGGTSHTAANLGVSFQEIAAKVWNQVNQNAVAALTQQTTTLLNNKTTSSSSPTSTTTCRKSTTSSSSTSSSSDQSIGLNLVQKDQTTPTKKLVGTQSLTDDPMWFWLRAQQEMLNLAQTTQKHLAQQQSPPQNTTNITSATSAINPNDLKNGSWFWKWYKNYYGFLPNLPQQQQLTGGNNTNSANIDLTTAAAAAITLENNILLQQLTKNTNNNDHLLNSQQLQQSSSPTSQFESFTTVSTKNNSNNITRIDTTTSLITSPNINNMEEPRSPQTPQNTQNNSLSSSPIQNHQHNNQTSNNKNSNSSTNKVRAVLDNLLTNNNNLLNHNGKNSPPLKENVQQEIKENEPIQDTVTTNSIITSHEAIEYGQKFLKWLEDCSDPAVTAMQVIQFRLLLNNIKQSADRKKNNLQNNTSEKVSRRK